LKRQRLFPTTAEVRFALVVDRIRRRRQNLSPSFYCSVSPICFLLLFVFFIMVCLETVVMVMI
jgi:hypothetical protein